MTTQKTAKNSCNSMSCLQSSVRIIPVLSAAFLRVHDVRLVKLQGIVDSIMC